jgi:hypothetical protein
MRGSGVRIPLAAPLKSLILKAKCRAGGFRLIAARTLRTPSGPAGRNRALSGALRLRPDPEEGSAGSSVTGHMRRTPQRNRQGHSPTRELAVWPTAPICTCPRACGAAGSRSVEPPCAAPRRHCDVEGTRHSVGYRRAQWPAPKPQGFGRSAVRLPRVQATTSALLPLIRATSARPADDCEAIATLLCRLEGQMAFAVGLRQSNEFAEH